MIRLRGLSSSSFGLLPRSLLRCREGLGAQGRGVLSAIAIRYFCQDPSPAGWERRRSGPLALYRSMTCQGKLKYDMYQENVAVELEDLLERLQQYEKDMRDYYEQLVNWEKNRESERQKLLFAEAQQKQDGISIQVKNLRGGLIGKWVSRRRHKVVEPGVGKMVSYLNREKQLDSLVGRPPTAPAAPKGIYIYGNVGTGKTMLMDMFYSATEGVIEHRRRFHFHEAMLEIHEHMHEIWKNSVDESHYQSNIFDSLSSLPFNKKVKDWLIGEERYKQEVNKKHILASVADKFLVNRKADKVGASILCFDEIQTVDVFSVLALSGIMSRLLSTGTVLVITSNRAPEDLNQDGMQKDIFLDFLSKLEENCKRIHIGSDVDYRRLIPRRNIGQARYFCPLTSDAVTEYEKVWHEITQKAGGKIVSATIPVMFGRLLEVPESCNGIARFDFEYLCGQPVGAADYIAVARNYHTVFVSNIPVMSMRIRDKARRFITLIDELYNHRCCLFSLAASSIDDLFQGNDEGTLFEIESFQFETETEDGRLRRDVLAAGSVSLGPDPSGILSLLSGKEEMFAFRRAVSRLVEMQTTLYIEGVQTFHPLLKQQKLQL